MISDVRIVALGRFGIGAPWVLHTMSDDEEDFKSKFLIPLRLSQNCAPKRSSLTTIGRKQDEFHQKASKKKCATTF
jgi:hypothetical protein